MIVHAMDLLHDPSTLYSGIDVGHKINVGYVYKIWQKELT